MRLFLVVSILFAAVRAEGQPAPADPARQLLQEARMLFSQGKRGGAVAKAEQAARAAERALGAHPDAAAILRDTAMLIQGMGDNVRSGQLYEQALEIVEKALGRGDPRVVPYLQDVARTATLYGDYLRAGLLYERVLGMQEKTLGPEHREVAQTLNVVALHRSLRGEWQSARPLFERALAIEEKVHGRESSMFAHALDAQAAYLEMQYDYGRAEANLRAALAIREKLRLDPREQAGSYVRLAWLHRRRGDLRRAEELYLKMVALYEKAAGAADEGLASFQEQLAQFYASTGQRPKAKPWYDKAEAIRVAVLAGREKQHGRDHPLVAPWVNLLASHYQGRGELAKAEPHYRRLLAYQEKEQGPDSLSVMGTSLMLGKTLEDLGKHAEAEALYRRAAALQEKNLGKSTVPNGLLLLAGMYRSQRRFADSIPIYERVVEAYRRSFGPRHPHVGSMLHLLAVLHWAKGDAGAALPLFAQAEDITEPMIALVLGTGTEADRRKFMADIVHHLDDVVSFHLGGAPKSAEAGKLALTLLLRRKGRVLDALVDTIALARRGLDRAGQKLLLTLGAKRAQLSRLVLQGRGREPADRYLARVAALEDEVRSLEQELAAKSAALRAQAQPLALQAIQARVPKGAALVEFVSYRAVDPKAVHVIVQAAGLATEAASERRYAAYVLRPSGPPSWVDLGEAGPIETRLGRLRKALASPDRTDARQRARALDEKVMRPVRGLVGDATQLIVSPDGALNLVPFGALVDEQDRFLLQRYRLSYVTSGRDLLRLRLGGAPRSGPVAVAAPAFGGSAEGSFASSAPARGRRSMELGSMQWAPLPGTASEAAALRSVFPDLQLLTGGEATEERVKALQAPRLLHVATHGFFLPEPKGDEAAAAENPLLRSGLVLSGANRRDSGEEDGVLTALEAAALDLWGTELVVLSACETGLGEVQAGEGVYGLRRALVLAGARAQVMSLWRVDDEATRDLMGAFYRRLRAGESASQALRQSQLQMLRDEKRAHPFYWAAFIHSGEWEVAE
jgi:CHAT domain-containing protein/tetratricopeptide (TPR) repeat protein